MPPPASASLSYCPLPVGPALIPYPKPSMSKLKFFPQGG
jgi:hypothetical protein